MSQIEDKPILNFDGKNYVIEDLSDQAKYFVEQLQDLDQQGRNVRARLDQIEVARNGFTELLGKELNGPEEETEE